LPLIFTRIDLEYVHWLIATYFISESGRDLIPQLMVFFQSSTEINKLLLVCVLQSSDPYSFKYQSIVVIRTLQLHTFLASSETSFWPGCKTRKFYWARTTKLVHKFLEKKQQILASHKHPFLKLQLDYVPFYSSKMSLAEGWWFSWRSNDLVS
jgi:hypothetical protein